MCVAPPTHVGARSVANITHKISIMYLYELSSMTKRLSLLVKNMKIHCDDCIRVFAWCVFVMAYREKCLTAMMGTCTPSSSNSTPSLFLSAYFNSAPTLRTWGGGGGGEGGGREREQGGEREEGEGTERGGGKAKEQGGERGGGRGNREGRGRSSGRGTTARTPTHPTMLTESRGSRLDTCSNFSSALPSGFTPGSLATVRRRCRHVSAPDNDVMMTSSSEDNETHRDNIIIHTEISTGQDFNISNCFLLTSTTDW